MKKEFNSQLEIQALKHHLKSKQYKAEADRDLNTDLTDSDMAIIKEGFKKKPVSEEMSKSAEKEKKFKSGKKKPVSPSFTKEANEMKEFLDSSLDKKKSGKSIEKKAKPRSSAEKTPEKVEKVKVEVPKESPKVNQKAEGAAVKPTPISVKMEIPELKLDSLEDLINLRKTVDQEIQKGNEKLPKLEEEMKRLTAELERKQKEKKMEKRKKRPSGICSEEPKEKMPRKEDSEKLVKSQKESSEKTGKLKKEDNESPSKSQKDSAEKQAKSNDEFGGSSSVESSVVDSANEMKDLLNTHVSKHSKGKKENTKIANEMRQFLDMETEDSAFTPDSVNTPRTNKDSEISAIPDKETPYFDLADDIKNVANEGKSDETKKPVKKASGHVESFKGKKRMTVHPMIGTSSSQPEKGKQTAKSKAEEETESKGSRWDSVTKKISERRATDGSSDGEGERKVEKKNGGKIIIIKEIRMKYVDKSGKEENSDSDGSVASRGKSSRKSKDGKRKLEERDSEIRKSERDSETRKSKDKPVSKGLVKYSDSDTCSEKSYSSRSSRTSQDRHRGEREDSSKRRKIADSDEHRRHRDDDKSRDEYRSRLSRDGRSLGPRVTSGLKSSERGYSQKHKDYE